MKTIKKVMYLCLFATVIPFISCSDDVEEPSIVGSWEMVQSVYEKFVNGVSTQNETTLPDAKNYMEVEFKSDGTFVEFYSDSYTDSNGQELTDSGSESGTYELIDNSIVVVYDDEDGNPGTGSDESEFSLTDNQLIILFEEEVQLNGDTIKYTYESTFNRK